MNTSKQDPDFNLKPKEDDMLKLDNQLCFALYVTSKEVIKKYKPLLDPLGLTYTAYITLLALWEQDHITLKELGQRLYLDSGTLTPLLKKLEAKGLLIRQRSPKDERRVYIILTQQGKALKKQVLHIPKDLLCTSHLDQDPSTAVQLRAMLQELMPLLKSPS